MAFITSGKEFKLFCNDPKVFNQEKESWMDELDFVVNDNNEIDPDSIDIFGLEDTDIIKIIGGTYYPTADQIDGSSLSSIYKKWKKNQEEINLIIRLNKKDKSEFLEELVNIYSMVFDSILPQENENEKKMEFNEIENWSNNLKKNYQNIMEFIAYFYHVLTR